ncbi:MAG TPA: ribonuclease P protein component [Candidatus Paceibacterota bacterium]
MLPKKRRIVRKDFSYISNSGKRLHSPIFLLNLAKNKANSASQVAFSVSKKTEKSAVKRNKLRRLGYRVLENNIKLIKPGFFAHFLFKKIKSFPEYEEIEKEVVELLSKSSVLE